ncbi:MAG: YbaK/EbsC family protein [Calditrichia bacterium]
MPRQKLKDFLDANGVRFVTIIHSRAYTAQELAHSVHIPGHEFAKSVVVVGSDDNKYLAVLPADHKVNFEKFARALNLASASLATEEMFASLFPGCELGAMPPFGSIYKVQTVVDSALKDNEYIAFNACSHSEVIKLNYKDYESLEKPIIADISEHLH